MAALPAKLRPHPEVVIRPDGEGALALHLATQQYFELNATGRAVWDRLAAGESPPAISAALAQEWSIPLPECTEAVEGLIGDLLREGLLVEEGGGGRRRGWLRGLARAARRAAGLSGSDVDGERAPHP